MKKTNVRNSEKIAVTFETPANVEARAVAVVGDFNDWDQAASPMKRRADGSWSKTINLAPGTYRYRFVADGGNWFNDPQADRYEANGLGSDNSVVRVDGK